MIPTRSLESICNALDGSLGEKTSRVMRRVPTQDIGLIIPGRQPPTRYRTEVVEVQHRQWSKLVGVLFCQPTSKAGKEEILPALDYFHHRAGRFVDFFCVGYNPLEGEHGHSVPKVDGRVWGFDAEEFNKTRAQLELESRWKFSGETDLLLAVARKRRSEVAYIDYSCAIACNLEEMVRDGATPSIRAFFERIFRFGEEYRGEDPVWALSDQLGIEQGGNLLREAILKLLPEVVQKHYKAAKYFSVSDVSR